MIRFKDGFAATGATSGTPIIGASTMTITGITGIIDNGIFFTIVGDTTIYKVTGHTETGGNTTSITFSPGLVAAPASGTVITFGPHEMIVKVGEGNLSYTEKRKIDYIKDRGKLDTVRLGDEEPVEVRLDFQWIFLKANTGEPPSVEDVLKHRGAAADWVSSSSDPCEPYAIDIEIEYIPPCTTEPHEIITFPDFRHEDLGHDMKNGTVSMTGHCNAVEVSSVRTTVTEAA